MRELRWIEWLPYILLVGFLWVLFAINITGCASASPCVKPVIHLERPVLPALRAHELQCLSDDTYLRLVDRDLLMREAYEQCEAIVESLVEMAK